MVQKVIYSIGYGGRSWEEFANLLRKYDVKLVVDVRRWPTSKRMPWTEKKNIEALLSTRGIEYLWLGELLGGYREGGYKRYMETSEYRLGVRVVAGLSLALRKGFLAIMCMERLWFRCHRRFICDTLTRMGFTVVHIVDERRTYTHKGKA